METVIVTGAAGGMGQAIVKTLVDRGFHVAGIDLAEQSSFSHPHFFYEQGNVLDEEQVQTFVDQLDEVRVLSMQSGLPNRQHRWKKSRWILEQSNGCQCQKPFHYGKGCCSEDETGAKRLDTEYRLDFGGQAKTGLAGIYCLKGSGRKLFPCTGH